MFPTLFTSKLVFKFSDERQIGDKSLAKDWWAYWITQCLLLIVLIGGCQLPMPPLFRVSATKLIESSCDTSMLCAPTWLGIYQSNLVRDAAEVARRGRGPPPGPGAAVPAAVAPDGPRRRRLPRRPLGQTWRGAQLLPGDFISFKDDRTY